MDNKEMEKRLKNGICYRNLTLEVRKEETEGEEPKDTYIVEGYATTFNEPYPMGENEYVRVFEQVSQNAFDNADMSDVIVQYDHCGHVYARISNNTLSLKKDEYGLKCRIDLSGTSEGHKLYEEIKGGYTNKMSFGFTINGETRTEKIGADGKTEVLYTIDSVGKLYDVSAVSIPANDGTEISARCRLDAEAERLATEVEKRNEEEEQKRMEEENAKKEQEEAEKRKRWLFLQKNK